MNIASVALQSKNDIDQGVNTPASLSHIAHAKTASVERKQRTASERNFDANAKNPLSGPC